MERVHFDENENRRDCIGGKIKKEDHEMKQLPPINNYFIGSNCNKRGSVSD